MFKSLKYLLPLVLLLIAGCKEKSAGEKKLIEKGNRIVETGESNSDHIVILRGLEENDTVALSDPYAGDEKDKKENKTEAKEE